MKSNIMKTIIILADKMDSKVYYFVNYSEKLQLNFARGLISLIY